MGATGGARGSANGNGPQTRDHCGPPLTNPATNEPLRVTNPRNFNNARQSFDHWRGPRLSSSPPRQFPPKWVPSLTLASRLGALLTPALPLAVPSGKVFLARTWGLGGRPVGKFTVLTSVGLGAPTSAGEAAPRCELL
jgi:hypothetical protein